MPSAFKVQQTPTKKKPAIRDQENRLSNGNNETVDEKRPKKDGTGAKKSPSASPERANRRKDMSHFEEVEKRTSVPRKSNTKANQLTKLSQHPHPVNHYFAD